MIVYVTVKCRRCGRVRCRDIFISSRDINTIIDRARGFAKAIARSHFLFDHLSDDEYQRLSRIRGALERKWIEFGGFSAFEAHMEVPELGIAYNLDLGGD